MGVEQRKKLEAYMVPDWMDTNDVLSEISEDTSRNTDTNEEEPSDASTRVAVQMLNNILAWTRSALEFKIRDELVSKLVYDRLRDDLEMQSDPFHISDDLANEVGFHEHGYNSQLEPGGVVNK